MEEKLIGPLLGEGEFYSLLDGSIPALGEVKKVAAGGDLTAAKTLFARHMREGGYKERFFDNRETVSSRRARGNGETLLKEAERVLSHELKSCGITHKFDGEIDWFVNPTYNGYKEWTWQLSRHHDINILVKAYEKTGDEKYAADAVYLLTSWIRQAVRPEPDVGDGATLCWRTIEVGERMSLWPDLFFPLLASPSATDDFILDFCRSLYEHGARLIRSKTHNNWRNIELAGFASLAVLFPIFEVTPAWLEHVANGVYDHLVRQIHPDGFQFELSTTYHGVVLQESIHGAKVLAVSGRKMPEKFDDIIRKMFEMHVLLSQSGGIVPCLNDGRTAHVRSYLAGAEGKWSSELIEWAKNGLGEDGAPRLDTLHVFEYAGLVTMRDRWVDSKTSLFFDAGKIGRSHQHEDKLNLLIYRNGKEILAEGHSYAYDTSDIRQYVLSSFAHNTVTVDGQGQNRKKGYKWDDETLTVKEPVVTFGSYELDYAAGEYREAYGTEQEITDVVHRREVAFLKKPKVADAAVIVVDTITGEKEHTYEAMWHFDIPELTLEGRAVTSPEINVAFGADVGELSVVKGQTDPRVQGFVCRSTIQGDYEAIPTVLNTICAKDAKMLTVFTFGEPVSEARLDGKTVTLSYRCGKTETVTLP